MLCSAKSVASVLVFWNGLDNVAEIGPKADDRYYVSFMPDGTPIYQRTIWAVGKKLYRGKWLSFQGAD